jgi:hypothetical protein
MFWHMRAWKGFPFCYEKFVREFQVLCLLILFPLLTLVLANENVPFAGVIACFHNARRSPTGLDP